MVFDTRWILVFAVALVFSGCGNYTSSTKLARDEYDNGKYSEAAKLLESGAREEGVDQLLYVLDRATALHHAGEYEESNKEFHFADKLAEIKDYTSLSQEAVTLITNDKIIAYKGEDFENVLISQYLALNYLMLGKQEDALVECRRVNHKLHKMIFEGKRKYKLNPMASYLAALIYESQGEWDHAFIDYQAVEQLMPEFAYLKEDLYRLAWRNRIIEGPNGSKHWAEVYHLSSEDQKRIRETSDRPELIVLIENGRAPEKQPHPNWQALPHFVPRYSPVAYVDVKLNGEFKGRSQLLFDIEKTAIENLDEKFKGLLAKRIGGVVAKEVIADQVGRRTDPLLGAILRIGMHAVDQADLRSWLTLPKDFQIFRYPLEEGADYKLQIHSKSSNGLDVTSGTTTLEKIFHVEPKQGRAKKIFVHFRVF